MQARERSGRAAAAAGARAGQVAATGRQDAGVAAVRVDELRAEVDVAAVGQRSHVVEEVHQPHPGVGAVGQRAEAGALRADFIAAAEWCAAARIAVFGLPVTLSKNTDQGVPAAGAEVSDGMLIAARAN